MTGTPDKPEEKKRTSLFRATTMVFAATVVSAVFGLFREVVIAREFGTSRLTDAYFLAFEFVISVSEFMIGGVAAALIAVYTATKRKKSRDSDAFGSTVINTYVIVLVAGSLAFALVAPVAGPLLASGFDEAGRALVIKLMWCLAPTLALFSFALILKSLLQAEERFFVSQVSTVFLAISVVAITLLFADEWGIFCLPIGMVVGTALQTVWTLFWLLRSGFQYRLTMQPRMPEFKQFLSLLWPGIAGGVIVSVMPLIDKAMASHLEAGTVACLSFASRPMALVTRFGLYSLITALLPTFAWKAVEEDPDQFRETVSQMLRILVFITVPLSILLAALRVPLIQVLFERGNFDPQSTALTSSIFAALVCGLCPMAIAVATSTIFKSMHDTKTAAFVGGGSGLVSKLVFNVALIAPFGAIGLAVSTSLQYVASSFCLLYCLHRRLQGAGTGQMVVLTAKVLTASMLAYLAVHWVVTTSSLPPPVICVVGMLLGTSVYLVFAVVLRIQELNTIYVQLAGNRIARRYLPVRFQRMLP